MKNSILACLIVLFGLTAALSLFGCGSGEPADPPHTAKPLPPSTSSKGASLGNPGGGSAKD